MPELSLLIGAVAAAAGSPTRLAALAGLVDQMDAATFEAYAEACHTTGVDDELLDRLLDRLLAGALVSPERRLNWAARFGDTRPTTAFFAGESPARLAGVYREMLTTGRADPDRRIIDALVASVTTAVEATALFNGLVGRTGFKLTVVSEGPIADDDVLDAVAGIALRLHQGRLPLPNGGQFGGIATEMSKNVAFLRAVCACPADTPLRDQFIAGFNYKDAEFDLEDHQDLRGVIELCEEVLIPDAVTVNDFEEIRDVVFGMWRLAPWHVYPNIGALAEACERHDGPGIQLGKSIRALLTQPTNPPPNGPQWGTVGAVLRACQGTSPPHPHPAMDVTRDPGAHLLIAYLLGANPAAPPPVEVDDAHQHAAYRGYLTRTAVPLREATAALRFVRTQLDPRIGQIAERCSDPARLLVGFIDRPGDNITYVRLNGCAALGLLSSAVVGQLRSDILTNPEFAKLTAPALRAVGDWLCDEIGVEHLGLAEALIGPHTLEALANIVAATR